jgi:prepilin-type N-terminal cleavage/methylation domain-containing protein
MTNKISEQESAHTEKGNQGFTLLEVLFTIVILSVGLLGMAALTTGIINGNKLSNAQTGATTLSQDKIADMGRLGYAGTSATTATVLENYNSITGYEPYKRVTTTTIDSPAVDMKTITVTVYWDSDSRSVVQRSILAR